MYEFLETVKSEFMLRMSFRAELDFRTAVTIGEAAGIVDAWMR